MNFSYLSYSKFSFVYSSFFHNSITKQKDLWSITQPLPLFMLCLCHSILSSLSMWLLCFIWLWDVHSVACIPLSYNCFFFVSISNPHFTLKDGNLSILHITVTCGLLTKSYTVTIHPKCSLSYSVLQIPPPKTLSFPTYHQTCLRKTMISDSFTVGSLWNFSSRFGTHFLTLSPLGITETCRSWEKYPLSHNFS